MILKSQQNRIELVTRPGEKVAQKLDKKFVTPSTDESDEEFRGRPLVKSQVVKPQTKSGHGASDSGSETSPSTSKAGT